MGQWLNKSSRPAVPLVPLVALSASRSAQAAQLQDNFEKGVGRLQMYIVIKTSLWESFPLSLAGMAHLDACRGKAHCQKLMAEVDSIDLSVAEQTMHRLTLDALHPQREIRPLLQKWVVGDYDDTELPSVLSLFLGRMFLWPVVERWLEQPHSVMKRLGSFKHVGGAFCSLSIRFSRILKAVSDRPANLGLLVSAFERSRTPLQMAHGLGLAGHPLLQDCMPSLNVLPKSTRESKLRKAVGRAIYITEAKAINLEISAELCVFGRRMLASLCASGFANNEQCRHVVINARSRPRLQAPGFSLAPRRGGLLCVELAVAACGLLSS